VILEPGDILLYGPSSLPDWIVSIKTWTKISHAEIFEKSGMTLASRPTAGINRYAFRDENLVCIRRPPKRLKWHNLLNYFAGIQGQDYDLLGLLVFTLAVKQGAPNKQFCSELATNLYRAGGFEPFNKQVSADTVSPSMFWQTSSMRTIWDKDL
jgi:hypothetical protein